MRRGGIGTHICSWVSVSACDWCGPGLRGGASLRPEPPPGHVRCCRGRPPAADGLPTAFRRLAPEPSGGSCGAGAGPWGGPTGIPVPFWRKLGWGPGPWGGHAARLVAGLPPSPLPGSQSANTPPLRPNLHSRPPPPPPPAPAPARPRPRPRPRPRRPRLAPASPCVEEARGRKNERDAVGVAAGRAEPPRAAPAGPQGRAPDRPRAGPGARPRGPAARHRRGGPRAGGARWPGWRIEVVHPLRRRARRLTSACSIAEPEPGRLSRPETSSRVPGCLDQHAERD